MFTLSQIKIAHSKVKSGADFPKYIAEIKQLGVLSYEVFVADGCTDFYGSDGFKTSAPARYEPLPIAETCNSTAFKSALAAHQQGKTDYPGFCNDCARCGIDKWIVSTVTMTCTYHDKLGQEILVEAVPSL